MSTGQPANIDSRVLRHLSAPRIAPYLAATSGEAEALALYRWNVELSGAFTETLGYVEVILRNAIDKQLRTWNAAQQPARGIVFDEEWIKNPSQPLWALLNPKSIGEDRRHSTYHTALARAEADKRLRTAGHPRQQAAVSHDDLVAHINFGTWTHLLPRRIKGLIGPQGQLLLWNQAISAAFPGQSPTVIENWVASLHMLRNRVAHREPLIEVDAIRYNRTAIRLLKAIDSPVGDWFSGVSRIPNIVKRRP